MFQPIVCPNCGAAISNMDVRLMEVAQCAYCKASFRVPRSFTPEPDLGDLLLGADFNAIADIPGWQRLSLERTRTLYGPPPALLAERPQAGPERPEQSLALPRCTVLLTVQCSS